MKQGGKVLGAMLMVVGIILNPFFLERMFSNDGNITSHTVLACVFGVEILIVLFGIAIYLSSSETLHKLGISALSVMLVLALSVGIDRLYGRLLMPETRSLLFPAFSRAEHNTSEFELDVQINNLGFRGPNTTIVKKRKRVMAIGDSFTFGWGVGENRTWVHLLSEAYPDVEFLNLGQGGNHPGDYVRIARKAVPLLKPDLVLVAVLQGNDLHQLMRVVEFEEGGRKPAAGSPGKESTREKLIRFMKMFYPNLIARFRKTVSIRDRWLKDSRSLLSSLDVQQKSVYEKLNASIREQFESGQLNPSLIYEVLHHPDMFKVSVDTSDSLCRKGIVRMHDHLAELKAIAHDNGAQLVVLSLPNRPYGFYGTLKPLTELGFDVSGTDALNPDIPLRMAMKGLEVPLLTFSPNTDGADLFYRYDGHWNEAGNRSFAVHLTHKLDSLKLWTHFLTSSDF